MDDIVKKGVAFGRQQHADDRIVLARCQRLAGRVGFIAELLGHLADHGSRLGVDAAAAIEGPVDGSPRHSAKFCYFLHRDHDIHILIRM